MKTKTLKIEKLVPDDKNFNKGTEYGEQLIDNSIGKFGAGRSILIDKNNRIIAGNKSTLHAINKGIEDVLIVETDGSKLVAVKRTDIDLHSATGRELALADNATAKANIEFDMDMIRAVEEELNIDFETTDMGLSFEELGIVGVAVEAEVEEQTKRSPIFGTGRTALCDMKEKLTLHKRTDFYYLSCWNKSDDGQSLSDIKQEASNILVFAEMFTGVLRAVLGHNLCDGWCIITTPKRRNKEVNFADQVAKMVAKDLNVKYYEDAITCKNRDRIKPVFKLECEIVERNVIVLDDIVTTGTTLIAVNGLLRDKNRFYLVGINNN